MKQNHSLKRYHVFFTNALDFIPIIGSVKMALEGIRGEQFLTHKKIIKEPGRGIHTIAGFAFLVLDMTSVGTIFSEFGKGVLKIGGRVLMRSVGEVTTRDAVIHVVEEVGIHEFVKTETAHVIEKAENRLG